MISNGVETLVHYPIAPHKQKTYKELNQFSYPITELLSKEVVSLPISTGYNSKIKWITLYL